MKVFLKNRIDLINKKFDISYLMVLIYFIDKNLNFDDNLKHSMINEKLKLFGESKIKSNNNEGNNINIKSIPKFLNNEY